MTEDESKYNTEVGLLDGLFAFHPEIFRQLSDSELRDLRKYYLTGRRVPADIFAYRSQLVSADPSLERRAHLALKKICALFDITEIKY